MVGQSIKEKAWREIIRPAWKSAVFDKHLLNISPVALAFEKKLLQRQDSDGEISFDADVRNQEYWGSGLYQPAADNNPKAVETTQWVAQRKSYIETWGEQSDDPLVREAVSNWKSENSGPSSISLRRTACEIAALKRVLFIRRVLAAWVFIDSLGERDTLNTVRNLISIEETPLPIPTQ